MKTVAKVIPGAKYPLERMDQMKIFPKKYSVGEENVS